MFHKAVLVGAVVFLVVAAWPQLAAAQNQNLTNCLYWCEPRSECVACSSASGCGTYYTSIQPFKTYSGNTWFACRARNSRYGRYSEGNRRECLRFCADRPRECDFCSTLSTCGPGFLAISGGSATGRGRNWHACSDGIDNDGYHTVQGVPEAGMISLPWW